MKCFALFQGLLVSFCLSSVDATDSISHSSPQHKVSGKSKRGQVFSDDFCFPFFKKGLIHIMWETEHPAVQGSMQAHACLEATAMNRHEQSYGPLLSHSLNCPAYTFLLCLDIEVVPNLIDRSKSLCGKWLFVAENATLDITNSNSL